jgi:hypothetical protein
VAQIAGVESELDMPFVAVHQLCGPILGHMGALPVPQQQALRVAFGAEAGNAPDRFVVGLAVLGLLTEVPRTRDGDQTAARRHQHQRAGREAEQRGAGALFGHAARAGGDAALRHAGLGVARPAPARLDRSDLRGLAVVELVVVVLAGERRSSADGESRGRRGDDGHDAVLLEVHGNPFPVDERPAGRPCSPRVRERRPRGNNVN